MTDTTIPNATPSPAADVGANASNDSGPADLDPRPALFRSLDTAHSVVSQLTGPAADRPTPCPEWTASDMAGHLVAVADRIVGLVGGADLDAMALVRDGIAPEWESALTSSIQQVRAAWAPDEVLTQMMTTPWASLPGAVAASIYSAELLVHTWDLAASIGVGPEWNEADVADAVTTLRFGLPADGRGDDDMPFDPVVPTADDAPHIHQLVAWVGRQPTWTA